MSNLQGQASSLVVGLFLTHPLRYNPRRMKSRDQQSVLQRQQMKPRLWASFIIFVSAYAPLSLLFAVRDVEDATSRFKHPGFVVGSLALAVASVALLLWIFAKLRGQFTVSVSRVELRSNDLMNYSIPYVISFFGVE